MTTLAPREWRRMTMARPIPREPPVTMATLPLSEEAEAVCSLGISISSAMDDEMR